MSYRIAVVFVFLSVFIPAHAEWGSNWSQQRIQQGNQIRPEQSQQWDQQNRVTPQQLQQWTQQNQINQQQYQQQRQLNPPGYSVPPPRYGMPAQGYRNAVPIVIPAPWGEEARRQRQLEQQQREAELRRQERLAEKERERQEKIARKEQARQERIAQEERRRQAEADRREQVRQAEIARQAAIQAAWELDQFKKQFNNGIVGAIALGVLLLFIPGYRVHAQDRLFHFKEWPFKGFFIVSSLALGGFIALLNDGISNIDTGHVAAFVGLFGIPAAFYVPGLVLLFFNYLHYLFVPHPAEEYLNREAHSRDPALGEAKRAAESMYRPGSGNVFDEWRARNHKRRVEAMTELLKKENEAMEALIKNQNQKADLNDRKRS